MFCIRGWGWLPVTHRHHPRRLGWKRTALDRSKKMDKGWWKTSRLTEQITTVTTVKEGFVFEAKWTSEKKKKEGPEVSLSDATGEYPTHYPEEILEFSVSIFRFRCRPSLFPLLYDVIICWVRQCPLSGTCFFSFYGWLEILSWHLTLHTSWSSCSC